MRMIRGAGLRGAGGIHPRLLIEDEGGVTLLAKSLRPLLTIRRRELEQYLGELKQPWREDSSNADEHFTRNRLRKLIVPLLEKEFNPAVAENLAELAEIARGEEDATGKTRSRDGRVRPSIGRRPGVGEVCVRRAEPGSDCDAGQPVDPAFTDRSRFAVADR